MRILVVEDDSPIRNSLRVGLESECFVVDEAEDGEQGSYMARTNQYSLILLDNIMPRKYGKDVCKELREAGVSTPILMLSVRSGLDDKVTMLNCGADDYMTKPFSFEELLARMRCLLRRPVKLEADVVSFGSLVVDVVRNKVEYEGKYIHFTRKEFSILELLLRHPNNVLTKGQIIEYAWDINSNPFSNTLETHIFSIRNKLGDKGRSIIQNVQGRGYRLCTIDL